MFHPPAACHIFFSYSLQMVENGSSCSTTANFLQTALTVLLSHLNLRWTPWAKSPPTHMIKCGLKIFFICSLQFAVVNRDIVKDVVSVLRVVWAINVVTLFRGLTVINPNIISSLRLLTHREIKKSLCTWWLQYRKLQEMFKVSPSSLQTFIDTPNCVLEDRVQYNAAHIPNVICDGRLQPINCVRIVRIHWVFTVRVRSHRFLDHPVFSPVVPW